MDITLGTSLKIRSNIYIAAEPIPFFWPMRTFIHHNPLHGLEHLPFAEAVAEGARLFHGRTYLPRKLYQEYWKERKVDHNSLYAAIARFVDAHDAIDGIDLAHWLKSLVTQVPYPITGKNTLVDTSDIHACLNQQALPTADVAAKIDRLLRKELLTDRPVYAAVDVLQASQLGEQLNELVINSCLAFFDEGQSVWGMPERQLGFFKAWRDVVSRNVPFFLRGVRIGKILQEADTPEGIIAYVLHTLGVPEEDWMRYFTHELVSLHGWVGFIRWRNSAKNYYWTQRFPADLVDYLAIRLTLSLALLRGHSGSQNCCTHQSLVEAIGQNPQALYLRTELHLAKVLPPMAHKVGQTLARAKPALIEKTYAEYVAHKRQHEAQQQVNRLRGLAECAGATGTLQKLSVAQLDKLLKTLAVFEKQESLAWLRAMEDKAIKHLIRGVSVDVPPLREKRPFAQAMFCIDTRSERIRRNLENVGDYQTFGIAGFFGVPVSFMEMGKGSEVHLCPVILTPQNLVPEISIDRIKDTAAVTALEKAVHELKESVLTPFVTVEAIGLLFGFDMVGKTVAPASYNRWRKRLHPEKPATRMMLDKLSRKQADSIVRAVQRAVIINAAGQDLSLAPEEINDGMVRKLRELALENQTDTQACAEDLGLEAVLIADFVQRLQSVYRINKSFAQMQLERLGRIGFTLDEQTNYVGSALRAIGMTETFSRFVLLVGHGSTSENNPYESALDCGACGGNHGIVSARVLAQMANKPQVRRRLAGQGIEIPDDAWFIPAMHNTTTDEVKVYDLDMVPSSHLIYLDRLSNGLTAAARLCAYERASLEIRPQDARDPASAFKSAQRNAMDWSQVRPEWGLSRNAYFIVGRRDLTQHLDLEGRSFLHSYDYRVDPKGRLLATILTGPLVVGQWINMEHYFSAVDNDRFGSGSKVNHNVAGRFAVMSGNLSDLRTGLPSQTVLKDGKPYHEPVRLITLLEAPFEHARKTMESVVAVKNLVKNGWIRMLIVDPETRSVSLYERGEWKHNYQISNDIEASPEGELA